MALLTIRELRAMKEGERVSESAGRGQGSLRFRKTGGRIRVYFRFTKPDGARDELPLGWYDEAGRDGWTLVQVRGEASKARERRQSGSGDVRADEQAEQADRKAKEQAQEAARQEADRKAKERAQFTLGALCEGYAAMLESRGKLSTSKHVVSMVKHVPDDLAGLPANEITSHQIAAIIRQVRESGKERAAGILRAYLRAAYGAAIRAPFDSELPASLILFNVEVNPVDAVPAIAVRAGNRTLSRVELRAYLEALGEGIIDQALMLALLAGGQRMAQLLRARVADWDQGAQTLRLWDGKGKRADPREHLLPLGPRAAALVEGLIQRARERSDDPNPSLFLSTGKAQVVESTPGKRVSGIAASMKGEPFDLRDIRRTVETLMAGLGINRDTRAQLMSHGLSGVQAVHYDRHGYMDEKRRALIAWESSLFASDESNVVELKRKRSA